MRTSVTVPVSVTTEAAVRIAALDLQAEVDRMIDYARHHLSELDRIDVELYERYELGDDPGLAIECYGRRAFDPADTADRDLDRWTVSEFPPEVLQHIIICYRPGAPHAG